MAEKVYALPARLSHPFHNLAKNQQLEEISMATATQSAASQISGVRRTSSWGRFSFSGICWSFVFGVRCLWRHNLTSYSCFQTNVLAKFVDIICIFFYTRSPYFV